MRRSHRRELFSFLRQYAEENNCDFQTALQFVLADLRHITEDRGLFFAKAYNDSLTVFMREFSVIGESYGTTLGKAINSTIA